MLRTIRSTVMVAVLFAASLLQAAEPSKSQWRPTRDKPLTQASETDASASPTSRTVIDLRDSENQSVKIALSRTAQVSETLSGPPFDVEEYAVQNLASEYQSLPGVQFGAFGEYLLWRPRGFAVDYAVILENPRRDFDSPLSPVAQVDPGFHSGFRAGFNIQLDPCCRIEAAYTWFEADDSDSIESAPAGDNTRLQALVVSQRPSEDWDHGSADLQVDLQLVDVDYHCTICGLDYFAGVRYGQLTQDFRASFSQVPNGFRNGWSGIEFNGVGPRFGIATQHPVACSNWLVYGRFTSSFLAGEFDADFRQESDDALPNNPPIEINTSNDFSRIVPILDLELGVAWENPRRCLRLSAGYLLSAWFNVVTTDNFIAAVHSQEFDDLDETITFDGLVARAEVVY